MIEFIGLKNIIPKMLIISWVNICFDSPHCRISVFISTFVLIVRDLIVIILMNRILKNSPSCSYAVPKKRCLQYPRVMNSTVTFFYNKVKELTGAAEVIALNSGMAVISNTLFSNCSVGKNIITSCHLFGNTYSFIAGTLSRFGWNLDFSGFDRHRAEKVDSNTCCIYGDITNP